MSTAPVHTNGGGTALTVLPPPAVTPTVANALGCPRYCSLTYLTNAARHIDLASESVRAGGDFKRYRIDYADHLKASNQPRDRAWVDEWLEMHPVVDDARQLIWQDAESFHLDPASIVGSGIRIYLDEEFLAVQTSPVYAARLEIVTHKGDTAYIWQSSTGFGGDSTARDYDAYHAAGCVLSAFPWVNYVEYNVDYRRSAPTPPTCFSRQFDLPHLRMQMRSRLTTLRILAARLAKYGIDEIATNSAAGLCRYCKFACPEREAFEQGIWMDPPLQCDDDAKIVALRAYAARLYYQTACKLLEAYTADKPGGALDIGAGLEVRMRSGVQTKFPLDAVLAVLGYRDVAEEGESRRYRVPLDGLSVSSSDLKRYAKAKMRTGMLDELLPSAKQRPTHRFGIGRAEDKESWDE